jgi:hypothetical protein
VSRRSVAWDDGEAIPGTPFRHLIRAADTEGRFSTQSSAGSLRRPFEEMGALRSGAGPDTIGEIAARYGQTPHPELIAELTELYDVSP